MGPGSEYRDETTWSETHGPFEITTTTSLPKRRLSTLKQGATFGLFNPDGDVTSGPGSPEGRYQRHCRHRSMMGLPLERRRPRLLSSALRDDNVLLTVDLASPDIFDGDRLK